MKRFFVFFLLAAQAQIGFSAEAVSTQTTEPGKSPLSIRLETQPTALQTRFFLGQFTRGQASQTVKPIESKDFHFESSWRLVDQLHIGVALQQNTTNREVQGKISISAAF